MARKNVARDLLWPTDTKIVIRACFLYVGQGSSILLLIRDGDLYRAVLIDSNLDTAAGGIDVPRMLLELLEDNTLHLFINTHPHDDHLKGIKRIHEELSVENVWHSGHVPSKKYGEHHPELVALIDAVKKKNKDAVRELEGSNTALDLLDAKAHVLAPAVHVKDDVNDEDPDVRYRRIHENCAVIRFSVGLGDGSLLVTGDADLCAFQAHITEYHKDHLPSTILDASHHGSRTFFVDDEEDEPYMDALEAINPQWVVVSAPTVEESRHCHPHEFAMKLYREHVGADHVLHTGKERETFFFDIFEDGTVSEAQSDNGDLADEYGLSAKGDGDDNGGGSNGGGGGGTKDSAGPFKRPAAPSDPQPRRYARARTSKATRCDKA